MFSDFGLVVNTDKTEGPAQQLSFLGIQLDSIAQTLSCTAERLAELRSLLTEATTQQRIKLSFLATLIGKLQFAATVLPGARPFVRRMLDLQQFHHRRVTALHSHASPSVRPATFSSHNRRLHFALQHSTLFPDRGFRADARFWLSHLHQWNGTAKWRSAQSAPYHIASDASLNGFGFYIESIPPHADTSRWPQQLRVGSGYSGEYSSAHSHLHSESSQMTWCELFAVYAALSTYSSLLRHSCVLFYVDNETDVHILNRQATRSARLAGLLREIYTISLTHNISIYACHRSGATNILADFLSRPELHQHRHVQRWRETHPQLAHCLSRVSVVSSDRFVQQQILPAVATQTTTCSSTYDTTLRKRISHTTTHSPRSADTFTSTAAGGSARTTCVRSSADTPRHTKRPPSVASSRRSRTTPRQPVSAICHAV
jgi:ribosomal protein L18